MQADLKRIFSLLAAITIVITLLGTPQPAAAGAYINVNFYDDAISEDGPCSLREAIIATNENRPFGGCPAGSGSSMDYIYLPARSFALRIKGGQEDGAYSGDLDITDSLTIIGSGSSLTTIYADPTVVNFNHRIFHVRAGTSKKVFLSNIKIYNGNAAAVNEAAVGGGILNDGSDLTVNRVLLLGNKSNDTGGGIANTKYSLLKIESSQFDSNWAKDGGGLFNQGRVEVWNSLFVANTGNGSGGGMKNNVFTANDWAYIYNSTFTQNISPNGGAGLYNDGRLYLANVTIYNNQGTGVMTSGSGWIQNSIIASHPAGIPGQTTGGNCVFLPNGEQFISKGNNFEDLSQCSFTAVNDITNQNPGIEGLADDGGPTRVLKLSADSLAIDKGNNETCTVIDQRLFPRPIAGNTSGSTPATCDIGAYEYGSSPYLVMLPYVAR